jgi:hypothetical protein
VVAGAALKQHIALVAGRDLSPHSLLKIHQN